MSLIPLLSQPPKMESQIEKLQLQYTPKERRFVLIEQGKNDLCFTTFKGKAHELFETSLFSLGGAKDCFVDLIRYSHIGYDLWKRFETFDCLRTCSFSFRIIDEALTSKLVCLHGCEHVALHLSTPMGFSCSILLAFGLQIYLKPFLLTHGYSFQLSQFQSIPFDRGKLSKSCCDRVNQWLDLRTSRSKEGGDDTATPRAHFWTSSLSIACKSMQAEIVQFLSLSSV